MTTISGVANLAHADQLIQKLGTARNVTAPLVPCPVFGALEGGATCYSASMRASAAGLRGQVIDKLEFFITVAKEHSFSRAAEICGVTQPTLSAGIKQLEDTLGVLLVNRSSRFHGLTKEGEHVLIWAKRIVSDTRAMRIEVRTLREGLSGQLKIAAIPDRHRDRLGADRALSGKAPQRALQGVVGALERNSVDAGQSRYRRGSHLSRQ